MTTNKSYCKATIYGAGMGITSGGRFVQGRGRGGSGQSNKEGSGVIAGLSVSYQKYKIYKTRN